jgi:hypothetical protein
MDNSDFDLIKRNSYRNKYPVVNCSLTSKKKGTSKLHGYPHHKKHFQDRITGNHSKVYRYGHHPKSAQSKKMSQINKNEIKKVAKEPYELVYEDKYNKEEEYFKDLLDYFEYMESDYRNIIRIEATPIKVKCLKLKKKKAFKLPAAPPVSRKLSEELDELVEKDTSNELVEKDYVIVYSDN